jgi:NADPH:quinone reductase-like Zn-dependent oxidoreductase
MGEEYVRRGTAVLKRGGALVQYGAPQTKSGFFSFLAQFLYYNLLPNGKRIKGYGTHRLGVELFAEDWEVLFKLLETGKIKPVIARRFSLQDIVAANELMENGQVTGNVVVLSDAGSRFKSASDHAFFDSDRNGRSAVSSA